ncbi:MAG: FCD domain-containing protein [Bryobacteraceae bacterium]|nr:FCD domain-containing protein [Bryobacteraceae bacterium]
MRLGLRRLGPLCDRLADLNRKMEHSGAAAASRYSLDSEFHRILAGTHDNGSLQKELDRLRRVVRGHDGAWERGLADVRGSCAAHAAIVEAIRAEDAVSAERTLARHWEEGTEIVCEWLKRREGESK